MARHPVRLQLRSLRYIVYERAVVVVQPPTVFSLLFVYLNRETEDSVK